MNRELPETAQQVDMSKRGLELRELAPDLAIQAIRQHVRF